MAKIIPSYVHELLRDIRELTSRQFVDDTRWGGFVSAGDALSERQTGPAASFADLHWQDKANVLRDFISWDRYSLHGLDWHDHATIEYNVVCGKPPDRWLESTSLLESFHIVETREELIQETFELSREIGYAHFLSENFDRPDPALIRLNPQERETFLRQWWDAARERMYASYLEQVAGLSNEELARNREAYKGAMIVGEAASVAYLDMLRDAAARGVGRDEGNGMER